MENGLKIPYIGYFKLDVEALGTMLCRTGILIIKDPAELESIVRKRKVPELMGMNIIAKLGE